METRTQSPSRRLGAAALVAGALSGLLLAVAVVWVHHWSSAMLLLVASWALAMLGTPPLAVAAHRAESAPRLATWGAVLNGLAWFGLGFLGLALLAGVAPDCGGV